MSRAGWGGPQQEDVGLGHSEGRQVFKEDEFRDALNRHYGKLLKLSQKTVGCPSDRETVMLGKIRKLERQLDEERELKSEEWDPIRSRMTNKKMANRDRDIQVNIYGLETSIQSIATMDSAFDATLRSVTGELDDLDQEFRTQTMPGAPSFRESRSVRRSRRKREIEEAARNERYSTAATLKGTAGLPGTKSTRTQKKPSIRNSKNNSLPQIKFAETHKERKRAHAHRMTTGSQVISSGMTTQLPAAEVWGFPIYFGSDADRKNAMKKKSKKQHENPQNVELARMNEEEQEQVALGRLVDAEERELDFEKFVILADRFGALGGEMFCTSRRPGRLYEHLVYASAVLLQIWWKICWPHRKKVKDAAARLVQRVWRGHHGRQTYKWKRLNEDKVQLCVRRIFQRLQIAVVQQWHGIASQQTRIKRLMKRIMQGMEKHVLEMWRDGAVALREEREEKLKSAMHRFINRAKFQVLYAWRDYAQKMNRVKSMLAHQFAALEHKVFVEWAEYVHDVVLDRVRLASAVTIQRVARGMLGRCRAKHRFEVYTMSCFHIQRIVRGHLGRRRHKMLRREKDRDVRRQARQLRREKLRGEVERKQKEEAERLVKEDRVASKAAEKVDSAFMKALSTTSFSLKKNPSSIAKGEVKARMKELGKSSENAGSRLRQKAIEELRKEKRESAEQVARENFRRKHPCVYTDPGTEGERFWDELESEILRTNENVGPIDLLDSPLASTPRYR